MCSGSGHWRLLASNVADDGQRRCVCVGGVANGGPKTVSKQSNGIADQAKRATVPTISLEIENLDQTDVNIVKQKDRPKAVSLYPDRAGDQATLSAAPFCLRRCAMKPRPQKPRIIMAQVEGSGTAGARVAVKLPIS